jgi:glucosamine-6-phosphate deaminase
MKVTIHRTKKELGSAAAREGAALIRMALIERGRARIILATGASQFEMLESLVVQEAIDWSRVEAFHLDEYIGLPSRHPASFRKFLKERFADRLPAPLAAIHYVDGEADPAKERERLNDILSKVTIDAAFVGIGENGHLAFNDPPADFETESPYIVVNLDEACRRQQLGEGWFPSLEEVPGRAISMSIRQIMKSRAVICTVPDARKAEAVSRTLEGPVTPEAPASILQEHPDCRIFLDKESAAGLKKNGKS